MRPWEVIGPLWRHDYSSVAISLNVVPDLRDETRVYNKRMVEITNSFLLHLLFEVCERCLDVQKLEHLFWSSPTVWLTPIAGEFTRNSNLGYACRRTEWLRIYYPILSKHGFYDETLEYRYRSLILSHGYGVMEVYKWQQSLYLHPIKICNANNF